MGLFVAKIDPEPAFFRLAIAGGEHRHGRVIGVNDAACHNVTADPLRERFNQPGGLANPSRQRCPVEVNAVAGINLSLTVKRQVIAELRDQHVSQKASSCLSTWNGQGRHRFLRHGLAFAAGVGGTHMADHLEAAGDVIEDFGDVLAHFAHAPAASRAGAGWLVDDLPARQRLGQLAARLLRRGLFLSSLCRLRCCRWLSRGLRLGLCRLDLFELEFELFQLAAYPFRRGAEGQPLQARDLDFELLGLERLRQKAGLGGVALGCPEHDKPLEFIDIVGKVYRARHAEELSASQASRHHPAAWGTQVLCGARQSMPSSNMDICAGVSVTEPSLVGSAHEREKIVR